MQILESLRMNILIRQSIGRLAAFFNTAHQRRQILWLNFTPMAVSGGQPFQIFYMTKRGLNASSAISVPMGKYVVQTICMSSLWTIAILLVSLLTLAQTFNYIRPLSIIGWAANAAIMVGVLCFQSTNDLKKIGCLGIKILAKDKNHKRPWKKRYNQVIKIVTDFQA